MTRLAAGAVLLLGLTGCQNMDAVVQALAADQNAVCFKLTTPWGSTVLDRNWGCEAAPVKFVTAP